MFGEKQAQTVGSGAVAIQATGNVSMGMSFTEVRELCQLFLENNFPALRAEAKAAAEERVQDFSAKLEKRIVDAVAQIDPAKFRDPDVQACLNDAVLSAARRGEAANPDVLCTLVAERISAKSSPFKDIVLSEAVQVVPKLTAEQISLLCLTFFVQSMSFNGIPHLAVLESPGLQVKTLVERCRGISHSQKQHVQYAGACSVLNIVSHDPFEMVWNSYKRFGHADLESFKTDLRKTAPTFVEIIELYAETKLWGVTLTSVGQAIALASLSSKLPELDFSVWLH